MQNKEIVGGAIGTILSATGTALQTSEVLQIISLVITIIGGLISMILIPIINWYRKAKQDKQIDHEEINEAINIINEGINAIQDDVKNKGE